MQPGRKMGELISSEMNHLSGRSCGDRNPNNMMREELITAAEVARWLNVSRAWVFEHANGRRRPHLPSVKLGKSVRFRPIDVDAFIRECERFCIRASIAC